MWPYVIPCIIWLWGKGCVFCYWWCHWLEIFCSQYFNWELLIGFPSMASIPFITICVTCFSYRNSYALTPMSMVANGGLICSISFLLLCISYGVILHSLQNLSQEGKRKSFQTCDSHITMVVCIFVPCIFMYAKLAKTIEKPLTVFCTVIPPMLNPVIYSQRHSELTNAMKELWRKKMSYNIMCK